MHLLRKYCLQIITECILLVIFAIYFSIGELSLSQKNTPQSVSYVIHKWVFFVREKCNHGGDDDEIQSTQLSQQMIS